MTAELSKFYLRYVFHREHMNVRMHQFQGVGTPDEHCAGNKRGSGRSAVKWRKVGKYLSE
jgi:hypothetical protein